MDSLSPTPPLILVAEDDMIHGFVLCDALRAGGFAALGPFGTAAEALAILEAMNKPPAMALLGACLKDAADVPITQHLSALLVPCLVIITTHGVQEMPMGLRDAGGCLSKPLDMDELLGLTRAIVGVPLSRSRSAPGAPPRLG